MKKVLHKMYSWVACSSLVILSLTGFISTSYAQVDVTSSAGTPTGTYTTLKGAFDAVNAGTHQGTIVIGISANTTETAPAVLNSTGAGPALYTSINIHPTVDGVSVSGATTTGRGVIELKGADNVTIDGDNPNTAGINRNLTITNTAANTITYTSVIRIATAASVTSADNISVINCAINGSAVGRNVAGTTSTTGSENTTFGIYSGGNGGATAIDAPTAITSVTTNSAPSGTTINGLNISNNAVNAVARAIVFNGANAAVSSGVTVSNNLIGDQITTLAGSAPFTTPVTTVYTKGILISGTTSITISGNTIRNILSYVGTGMSAVELSGAIGSGAISISNNTINGVCLNAASANNVKAILVSNAGGAYTISGNQISNVQGVLSGIGTGTITVGIEVNTSAASGMIELNRITKVYNNNAGTTASIGVNVAGGSNVTLRNNFISDINQNMTGGFAFSPTYCVSGVRINGGTGHKLYNNSIHLSGTLLGATATDMLSAAVSVAGTGQTGMDIRNNIFSNTLSGGSTNIAHVAIALPSGGSSAMNLTLNNNAYYSGTDAARQGIAQVGTTAGTGFYLASNFVQGVTVGATNLRTYTSTLSAGGTNDNATVVSTAAAPFVSATDLHISTGVTPTQLESGGATLGVTTDIDGQTRPGPAGSANGGATAPDMGADEFDGVPLTAPVVTLNSVTPPAVPQCTATARLVSVNVANTSGTIASVTLVYAVNGAGQAPIAMTNVSGTTWEATIPVPAPVTATISWAVSATNSFGLTTNYAGTSYADEPLTGVTATATSSAATVCSGSPSILTAKLFKSGNAVIGSSALVSSGNAAQTPFYGGYGGVKTQYLIRASELTAAGLAAGNITSLGLTVSGAPGATLTGFAISAEATALTVLTGTIETVNNQVYTAPTFTPVTGLNTFTFSSPLAWDGTSNIIISFCWSNNNTSNTVTNIVYSTTPFVAGNARYVDSRTAAEVCGYTGSATPAGWNGGSTTVSSRPNFVITGNVPPALTAVSWSDGVGTVGTTNPLTVNPTATTTYTAAITAAGCPVSSSPATTVTVNPLPSAPTATNSAQCGVQIPTASVASTSGLPTPTFNWYAASSGGSALQSSTSATYTSTVAVTTTFYVSELNSVTGCESARTAVTVNVSTPDPIAINHTPAAICIGETVSFTVANTSGTPFQSYTYSTVSTTGSGMETPVAGASFSATPTAAGTYVYTATGTDGGCAATATTTVVVNALPVVSTATATPAAVCSGDVITLTGAVLPPNGGTATLGTQTTTEFEGVYRYGFGAGDFRHQLLYTAAEMTAAGFTAGNITSLAFNVTSVGSGSANNYTIKLANSPATVLDATFQTGTFTTVYTAATYTAVSGLNLHTFSAPFAWDGTSNIVVDICYNISTIGGSSTVAATTPAAVSNANLKGSAGACSALAGATTYANRPLIRFTMNSNSDYSWLWTPGTGLNTPVATTAIVNNTGAPVSQAFTVTVTNNVTGCLANVITSPVTINPATLAPVASNSTQCGPGVPAASVTGSGTPGNTFSWYAAASGGTAIAGQTGTTYTASVSTTTTFYVAENNGTCESPRTAVTVTVTPPPAIVVAGTATICNGTSTSLTVTSSNDPNYTYTWSNGLGTGATVTAAPTANTTYTVTAVDASGGVNNGCNISATYAVAVNPSPVAVTAASSDNTICNGETINLTSTANANDFAPATLTQGFETFPPAGWSFINAGSGNAWLQSVTAASAHSGTAGLRYTYNADFNANAWAMTPQMYMLAGQTYTISFWYKVEGSTFPEKLKVTVGNAATVAAQTTTLWNNNGGTSLSNTTWAQGTTTYTPATSGNYFVGFNCYSDADQYLLHLDDISVQYVTPPSTPVYSWTSSPAGFNSSAQNPTGVTPAVTTTYTVSASNSYGCSSTASTTVTVNQPTTHTISATACATYTLNSTTYNASGTYTQTLTNAAGCDSTITLNLIINQPSTSSTPITACSSYTWTNGTVYTTSGTYTQTLTNAVGCDSVATLVLTINQPTSSSTPVSACGSYTWTNGTVYNASGTYTQTLTNAAGCDSVATLVLTINQPSSSTLAFTSCGAFTFHGTVYPASGTFTQVIENAAGCDSTVTLNLTINAPSSSTTTATACGSYTWTNGTVYTTSGTYTQTLTNAVNCDSIATLVLTINQPTTSSTSATACGSYTWTNGTVYTASGTYTQTLTNAAGCDSVATLVLVINPFPVATATLSNGVTLTASAGSSYQWINCTTGLAIGGAQSQTFTATANGSYAVVVTNGSGCSDTSACVAVTTVGIKENIGASISVYPNPTHDNVTISMSASSATVQVVDAQGKLLQTVTVTSGDKVDLSAYTPGVYFLKVSTETGSALERVIKN